MSRNAAFCPPEINSRLIICCALYLGVTLLPAVHATEWEFTPQFGYQMTVPSALSYPDDRLDIQDHILTGLSIGYLNDEKGQLEVSWTRSKTSVVVDRIGTTPDHFEVRMDRFHLNGVFVTKDGPIQPFGLVGAGATMFNPSGDRSTETKFSFALGGGVKWLWNDYIGMRFDARWTPAIVMRGSDLFCDPNGQCYNTDTNSYVDQSWPFLNGFEFLSGVMLRY